MSLVNYEIRYYSKNLKLGLILQNGFNSLEYGQKKNDVGAASMVINLDIYNDNVGLFEFGSFMEIWRYNEAQNSVQLAGETIWLLVQWDIDFDKRTVELVFRDANWLLTHKINIFITVDFEDFQTLFSPASYPAFDKFAVGPSGQPVPQAYDDVQKFLIKFAWSDWQLDPLTKDTFRFESAAIFLHPALPYSDRISPYIDIDGFLSLAPFARPISIPTFEILLTSLQTISNMSLADGTDLWFQFVWVPVDGTDYAGSLIFKSRPNQWGADLTDESNSNAVIFRVEDGNFAHATLTYDYTDFKTTVYNHGVEWIEHLQLGHSGYYDYLTTMATLTAQSNTLISTIELGEDLSGDDSVSDSLANLEQAAIAELHSIAQRPKIKLKGEIISNEALGWGTEFKFGDRVAVQVQNFTFTSYINQYTVEVDNTGEKVRIPFDLVQPINEFSSAQVPQTQP